MKNYVFSSCNEWLDILIKSHLIDQYTIIVIHLCFKTVHLTKLSSSYQPIVEGTRGSGNNVTKLQVHGIVLCATVNVMADHHNLMSPYIHVELFRSASSSIACDSRSSWHYFFIRVLDCMLAYLLHYQSTEWILLHDHSLAGRWLEAAFSSDWSRATGKAATLDSASCWSI